MTNAELFKRASAIASKELRACYVDGGIIAGIRHFDDFWARDALFASWGVLALGDFEQVRQTIELFLRWQQADGLIPRRLDRFWGGATFKYATNLRFKLKTPTPVYRGNFN